MITGKLHVCQHMVIHVLLPVLAWSVGVFGRDDFEPLSTELKAGLSSKINSG